MVIICNIIKILIICKLQISQVIKDVFKKNKKKLKSKCENCYDLASTYAIPPELYNNIDNDPQFKSTNRINLQ